MISIRPMARRGCKLPDVSEISFKNQCYSNVYYNFAKKYVTQNDMYLAKKYFLLSLKLSFFNKKSIKIIFGILLIYIIPNILRKHFNKVTNY